MYVQNAKLIVAISVMLVAATYWPSKCYSAHLDEKNSNDNDGEDPPLDDKNDSPTELGESDGEGGLEELNETTKSPDNEEPEDENDGDAQDNSREESGDTTVSSDEKDTGDMGGKESTLKSILPKDCGRVPKFNISGYVAGGFAAQIGEYPPYVRLNIFNKKTVDGIFLCGGTIITDRHIVTAAHCLDGEPHSYSIDVRPTIHAGFEVNGTIYKGANYCISPNYVKDAVPVIFDIALITLKEPIQFNDNIQPACMPDSPLDKKKTFRAVGLGADDIEVTADFKRTRFPDVLQVLPVKNVECHGSDKHFSSVCFEASNPKYQGDTCTGDSGGPVFGLHDKKLTIYGATSHGPDICKAGQIGTSVNADIYNLRDEIERLYKECGHVREEEEKD